MEKLASHLDNAYAAGIAHAEAELQKNAGQGIGAAGALVGPLAGLGADDGKGWSTAGGALLGGLGGAIPDAVLTQLLGRKLGPHAMLGGALAAPAQRLGGYLGARWGHGDYDKKNSTLFGG